MGINNSLIGPIVFMKKVAIVAYEGCWAMSLFLAKDFFRIVTLLDTYYKLENIYDVEILTCSGEPITSSSNSIITPDNALTDQHYDLVIIPPIEGDRLHNMPLDADLIVKWLKPQILANTTILSLSTGSYFLAASGVLNKTMFATHWAFVHQLQNLFPDCQFTSHKSHLKTGNIYTTGSFEAGINVLLGIVAGDKGDHFSQRCATHLLISEPSKLSPILPHYHIHNDERVTEVQDWIDGHFQQVIRIVDLAKMFNFSERNLKRRFSQATDISINKYVQEVRVDKAKKLLLATEESIKNISFEVGYENDSFFSRLFKRKTGMTPSKWRSSD